METLEKQETIIETANEKEVIFTDTSTKSKETQDEVKKEVKYTQEQVDEIVKSRLAREKKRQDKKDPEVEKVQATETETIEVIEKVEKQPQTQLSEREQKILAEHFANEQYAEIEKLGIREMEYEANKLAGTKRNAAEDALFMKLGKTLKQNADKVELEKQGIDGSILADSEFINFTDKLSNKLTATEKYEMYMTVTGKEKKEPETIGSIKDVKSTSELKEYYTKAEIAKFTRKDYEANPELMKRVEKSLQAKK